MTELGERVARVEDRTFLTVGGTYCADVRDERLDGAAYVTFVRSTMAHARLAGVDVDDARGADGVLGVFTADDLDDLPPPRSYIPGMIPDPMARPWLATGTVRFVGEPIVAVVTESPLQGEDAAELVIVDYEPLPAVVDVEQALRDEVLLFPEAGTNTAIAPPPPGPDLFEGCEVVVRQRLVNQRLAACPLEVRSAAVAWSGGRLVMWISTQAAHSVKTKLAELYGFDEADVHVIAPDVGGGFGAKISPTPEELVLPSLARRLGRPLRWTETRSESMVGMPHGRAQVQEITIGGRRDGTIEAYRLSVVQDCGAYPSMGSVLTFMTRTMTTGVYDIPAAQFEARSVVTNTTPTEAYRGAGRPEATAAIERAVDLFAAEIGLDPIEVRRRNLVPAEKFPYTTAVGTVYDTGDYERALDLVLDAAGIDQLRAEQAARRGRDDTRLLGIGVSVYVEITAGPGAGQEEYAKVEVHPDGRVTVFTGSSAHGQGHATSFSMIVSHLTGIPLERIEVVHGDTDRVAEGSGTFGSRSLQVGGSAVHEATARLIDRARQVAGGLLGAPAADISLDTRTGRFHVGGLPEVDCSWADVAAAAGLDAAAAAGPVTGAGLAEIVMYSTTSPTFPFGAHLAVVEVDVETGRVELVRMVTCDDAGRIVNPLIVEGQRHGGIAQGVAQALLEEVRYDPDGNPTTSNLADYGMISSAELPSFELVTLETPTPVNALGAKGIGESGTIGATPAVQSAVIDALAHLGVRHIDMPLTAERVWRAVEEATRATQPMEVR
ncbi:xanthine dehydrogenase family protein molybdopterin-binding subunit [Rhabdothermincola sp.]|uniref:xanthine dehydrogenase family protein molybdopterin-binding subunit n=1 Tax=Rhabdothermincola sp. TaxID=2820405 RepID=UPI002FDF2D2F